MTELYAVIGAPVAHSRSPAMMNAAFAALGIDATYVALEVHPGQIRAAVEGIRALGLAGVNVTIPHKEAVLVLCDELDPSARLVGAVNTIARSAEDRRLVGHNTDAPGFVDALREARHEPGGGRAVILGAGGAARAVAVGLATAGAASITIAGRSEARALEVVGELSHELTSTSWSARAIDGLGAELTGADLLVNCTPAGMEGGPSGIELASALPIDRLGRNALVVDLVYRPRETSLLARARETGLKTLNGSTMLLHQGARAFTIWRGSSAPLDRMREVLESADS